MKTIRYLFMAVLVLASLPAFATAAPAAALKIADAELHAVTGGACITCNNETPEPGDKVGTKKVGKPYWEFRRQVLNNRSYGPWVNATAHYNGAAVPMTFTFSYTDHNALNWSVGGGLPASIVQASLGRSFSKSETRSFVATLPPRTGMRLRSRHVTDNETHYYTLYQDYNGSREALQDGDASVRSTSTETATLPY